MTSKLKCPFCGKELTEYPVWGFGCGNTNCTYSEGVVGSEQLWQALTQAKQDLDFIIKEQVRATTALIERTKELDKCQKDLEIARKALKNMSLGNVPSLPDDETLANAMCNYARDTLKQIEHKE